ncbi:diguanylate cyclase (GGDEF)-like protein [Thiohalophilus thiocyanatoxydans]|uniref:diguanylate cyclase n=2 Tax=Thiohalophilus thiocyanatoxydans TaxID=381308 RepID=A0A4V3H3K8_9GAMM|nr:diguanylate cyclase (GGDEF)-like protein [Thiohalophilus thiocyanatoxydans]
MIRGTGLMLVPLLLLGGAGYLLYLQTIDAFESAMQQGLQIGMPVGELRRGILQLNVPVDRYPSSATPQAGETFEQRIEAIDRQFAVLRDASSSLAGYQDGIRRAATSWKELAASGEAILEMQRSGQDVPPTATLRFERQRQVTSEILGEVYATLWSEIRRKYQNARRDQRQIQILLLAILITAVGGALIVGNRLAQHLLKPLAQLRIGTERFGHGDLSHRIKLENADEFGRLARTFNEMADQLEFLAAYDSLTGLLNKREFELRLHDEVRRTRRTRHPFVLLLLDIDYFKQVNDTHGHPVGDHVLRKLAGLLQGEVREADYVGRYGGEEFIILLTETSEQDGSETAERIRQSVETEQFDVNEDINIWLTMSIGLACYPDDAVNADALIERADVALYKAKDEGRNQVVAFSNS